MFYNSVKGDVEMLKIKYISIIFDDGPRDPMCEMIDKFKEFNYTCGFAIIGNQICDKTLPTLKYAIDNGFELCSHSYSHVELANMSKQEAAEQLIKPIETVKKLLGYDIKTARTPYLQNNEMLAEISMENNLPYLGQGIPGAHDWEKDIDPKEISDSVINNVYDGAIITFHVTNATYASLDIMLPALKDMGYQLVTPSKLFEIKCKNGIPLGYNITKV